MQQCLPQRTYSVTITGEDHRQQCKRRLYNILLRVLRIRYLQMCWRLRRHPLVRLLVHRTYRYWPVQRVQSYIDTMEETVFQLYPDSSTINHYNDKIRLLYPNLRRNGQNLWSVAPDIVAVLPVAYLDYNSHHWQEQKQRQLLEQEREERLKEEARLDRELDMTEYRLETSEGRLSYNRCRRCHSSRIDMKQLQTRSCDEPVTNFHTCMYCGNRWKS